MDDGRDKRPTIGVLAGWQAYGGTLDTFLSHIFRGILAAAQECDCHLLLACGIGSPRDVGLGRPAWPLVLPTADYVPVGPWNADGLLVLPPFASEAGERHFRQLADDGYPILFAGDTEYGPAVTIDNGGGIRQAVEHLIEHGHRRIAFIAGRKHRRHVASRQRLMAFESILQERGLPSTPGLIAYGSHTTKGGRQAMEHILRTGLPFTALLASNDESAVGAMDVLNAHGLLIPQDVAVIGFDDRLEARAQSPPLTTIRYPMFELGYRATGQLIERIRGTAHAQENVRVPTRLVIRESCGCLPGVPANLSTSPRASQITAKPEQSLLDRQELPRDAASVVEAMTRAVTAELQRLGADQARHLCQRLTEALVASVRRANPNLLLEIMQQVLYRTTSAGGEPDIWHTPLSVLRDNLAAIAGLSQDPIARQQAQDVLDQARIAISDSAQERHARHQIQQASITYRLGQMVAQFHAVETEVDIYAVLADSLPQMGIEHATVAFYGPEGEDPVAWSTVQSLAEPDDQPRRFATRTFPPQALYPEGKRLSVALLPLLIQDKLRGFVALDAGNLEIAGDIARQLATALRSVELYREAVEGRRLAEEADRLKSRFLSMVSHELRTPLNLISGLSDMLLRERSETGQDRHRLIWEDIERIYVNAQHLDGLIQDVLDLAQNQAGQLKLVRESLDLGEIIQAIAIVGEQLARNKGLDWRVEVPDQPLYVRGDRTRLRQVLLNLVNNAFKFTAQGEIALSARKVGEHVSVSVRDTGLGIPPEEQAVIFDEFRQSERTAARGYGGLGLGLAICKQLVEMHGGEIGVRSSGKEGLGSTFTFSLPAMAPQHTRSRTDDLSTRTERVALLVKHSRTSHSLQEQLADHGFDVRVHAADDTPDWLSELVNDPPQAAILDLGLASERGWQVIKLLKDNPATRDVPVLFVALENEQGAGATVEIDYLAKPMGTAELSEALLRRGLAGREETERGAEKVLVVDDEPGILEMHTRVVEGQLPGCQVLRAQNGKEALSIIQHQRPDLVLLDLMMPELDGFGVLEAMHEHELSRNIPVIVLTGQALTQEDMDRLNQGVTRVLGKGLLSVEETLAHIEAVISQGQRPGHEARQIARKTMAFIHTHFAEPLSRADLAAAAGVSERHLARCFRQEMDMTVHSYLNRYRVRQAKQLLSTSGKSITEVALEVGFASSSHFSQVFRQETGVSPSVYRRRET